tara:strand:- start:16658 stop:17575 length:918 start_codon:yes stop_codon:yes gene_type:complete
MNRTLGFILALFTFAMVATDSHAQLSVHMKPTKDTFVAYEPVKVVLTITNRAGRDVVLAGRGRSPWLTFQVSDAQGHLVSPRNENQFQPVLVPPGQSLKRTITVNSMYSMSQKGIYRIRASVYFTQLDQFFNSKQETIQISDGKKLWHQVLGVPEGNEGAGTYRRFTLLSFNTGAEKQLYLRVQDEKSGAVMTTYSLGQVIMIRDPQWTIDLENRLHILHMGAPQTYAHSVIGIDGTMVAREVYREKGGDRPKMVSTADGDIVVVGGVSEQDEKQNPLSESVRKLSERPPGLPKPGGNVGAGFLN